MSQASKSTDYFRKNGSKRVQSDGKWNFIDKDGKLLSEQKKSVLMDAFSVVSVF